MTILEGGTRFLRDFAARLTVRRDNGPINSVAELQRFIASRSAFVAQHKLYGYLKTRMGTRYPSMFEDDIFIQSVNIAKMHVFAACLSDLTVHAVARATNDAGLSRDARAALARELYRTCIAEAAEGAVQAADAEGWNAVFDERLKNVNWDNVSAGADAFTTSPDALVRWAPIADELKRYDREIVENSVKFAWPDHVREFARRAVPEAIVADWRGRGLDTG